MTINTISELEKLIKLCKKHSLRAIKVDNIEFAIENIQSKPQIEDVFPEAQIKIPAYNGIKLDPSAPISEPEEVKTPDALTEEQLLYYSAKEEPGAE